MLFERIENSADLPLDWNALADNYFQQTHFLSHTELYNSCKQRYYTCIHDNKLVSAAVVYSIRLDLLTFVKIKSPIRMNIVGIPCSVSSSGIFGKYKARKKLIEHISKVEKGLLLLLNLNTKPDNGEYAFGKTLPTIVLKNQFLSWDMYLKSLRSDYRRRIKIIEKEDDSLLIDKLPCTGFSEIMYNQYLQVYNRSNEKLERLDIEFFKNLPDEFRLFVCRKNGSIIGWNISLEDQGTYYFFLGGVDYSLNKTNNTYYRLLNSIIKEAIIVKAELIELGQTAEVPKMRLGGKPKVLYMQALHSSSLFNSVLKLFSSKLEYSRKLENSIALKEDEQ